jgi:hypothetical protein
MLLFGFVASVALRGALALAPASLGAVGTLLLAAEVRAVQARSPARQPYPRVRQVLAALQCAGGPRGACGTGAVPVLGLQVIVGVCGLVPGGVVENVCLPQTARTGDGIAGGRDR